MSHAQNTQYLASKVLTAPPHRLHLMLIEGAIRYGRQAEAALRYGDRAAASEPLMRLIDVVGEMLAGVRETKTELNQQIADFYLFLFRTVAEAKVNDSVEKLSEALKLLEFERQTWQLVCDKLRVEPTTAARPTQNSVAFATPHTSVSPLVGGTMPATSLGISLEA
jgi:flagellar protein FliS